MKPLLIILFCFLSTGFIKPGQPVQCQDRKNAKPIAIGYNEHYAFQHQDGTVAYSIVDRAYYKCSVRQTNSRHVSKEEWENTFNEFRYEVVK